MAKTDFSDLHKKLKEGVSFPTVYMFKFIFPASNRTMAMLESLFEEDADIQEKQSEKGNYMSITVKAVMMNADEVIVIYEKASDIEGVMVI